MPEPINIFLFTFFNTEIANTVIDRLWEVTDYPFRLIVGDNLSDNSISMREMLVQKTNEGRVAKSYFFDENYLGSSLNYMFKQEPKTPLTIFTDQDAYLPDKLSPCWLTKYVEHFKSHDHLGMLGFHSESDNLMREMLGRESPKKSEFDLCLQGVNFKDCSCNLHWMAIRTTIMDAYIAENLAVYDGGLRMYIQKSSWLLGRLDEASVRNLSTASSDDYTEIRKKLVRGGKNKDGRSFREFYEIKECDVYNK